VAFGLHMFAVLRLAGSHHATRTVLPLGIFGLITGIVVRAGGIISVTTSNTEFVSTYVTNEQDWF
jgi:hypothetical protein